MITIYPTEHQEQMEFVKWFRQTYSPVRIFAIPNGEKRSISVANRLKCEGVTRGVPDLFIPEWRLWIEMKKGKGKCPEPHQADWLVYLRGVGYETIVGYGAKDAKRKIEEMRK